MNPLHPHPSFEFMFRYCLEEDVLSNLREVSRLEVCNKGLCVPVTPLDANVIEAFLRAVEIRGLDEQIVSDMFDNFLFSFIFNAGREWLPLDHLPEKWAERYREAAQKIPPKVVIGSAGGAMFLIDRLTDNENPVLIWNGTHEVDTMSFEFRWPFMRGFVKHKTASKRRLSFLVKKGYTGDFWTIWLKAGYNPKHLSAPSDYFQFVLAGKGEPGNVREVVVEEKSGEPPVDVVSSEVFHERYFGSPANANA